MTKVRVSAIAAAGGIILAGPLVGTVAAQASAPAQTVYVSAHGTGTAADRGCTSAAYHSVNTAISAVAANGTVVVCGGTYHEGVTITKTVTLKGQSGATIDATGQINGVAVTAARTTVSGLTVENAIGEGILVNGVNNVVIEGNVVKHNDLGGTPVNPVPNSYPFCQESQGVPGDCGEGIHLMGSSNSLVTGNTSTDNSGGILVSDETGPAGHNRVIGNVVTKNLYDCGITVVGHNPAAAPNGVPAPTVAGVFGTEVIGNSISGNGIDGEGAGVVIATGLPGGASYDNLVEGNAINGNGMSGVTVHSHAPGQDVNGNVIQANQIGTNNLKGDPDFTPADTQTTGVLVATVSPLSIQVVANAISGDQVGIWTTGPVTAKDAHANAFLGVEVPVSAH